MKTKSFLEAADPMSVWLRANGDVFVAVNVRETYVAHIDCDGDVAVAEEFVDDYAAVDDAVRHAISVQFANRWDTNWPEIRDWPVDILKAIAEDVYHDCERGQTRLTIGGRVYVFECVDAWEEEC